MNIYREDSISDYKRALRALGEITDNKDNIWDGKQQMLLMSNFGPEDPVVNFFATLDEAAHLHIFTDLYQVCSLEQRTALRTMRNVSHEIFILPGCGGSGKTWLCKKLVTMLMFQPVMREEGEIDLADMNTTKLFLKKAKSPPTKNPTGASNKDSEPQK